MLHDLSVKLEALLVLLDWSERTYESGRVVWVHHNEKLITGLRVAAEKSLTEEGEEDPVGVLTAVVSAYRGNEFLAYRSCLSEYALARLVGRFQWMLEGRE